MPDLIAQGNERRYRWCRPVPRDGSPRWIGRGEGTWSVPWDSWVSRRHVRLVWNGESVDWETEPTARNAVFVDGQAQARGVLRVGEHLVIGQTTFSLVNRPAQVTQQDRRPDLEQTFTAEALRHAAFQPAQQQVEALTRLPEMLAAGGQEHELWVRVVSLLLASILPAQLVGVLRRRGGETGGAEHGVDTPRPTDSYELAQRAAAARRGGRQGVAANWEIVHWDAVPAWEGPFEPSGALVQAAWSTQQSVLHEWHTRQPQATPQVTAMDGCDWAFCVPLPGQTCRGLALYIAGRRDATEQPAWGLHDALKFTELVGRTVGTMRDVQTLERQALALRPFFAAPVREALSQLEPDTLLAPREADVCVMFADLRGFSRETERGSDDLLGLLGRVSEALGVVTREILREGGVIGDFHGDAAMGFWGWPWPQEDRVLRACRAAVAIQEHFRALAPHANQPLYGFRVGLGLASGRAVAGKIGTVDQVKVTVFGPVVNLASRLESLTRTMGVSILIDDATARALTATPAHPALRSRPLLSVCPAGMEWVQPIHQLLGADSTSDDVLNGVREAFLSGAWDSLPGKLETLPADLPLRDFLLTYLTRHPAGPPATWDRVVRLEIK